MAILRCILNEESLEADLEKLRDIRSAVDRILDDEHRYPERLTPERAKAVLEEVQDILNSTYLVDPPKAKP